MDATYPGERMRPDADYEPGLPLIDGGPGHLIYRIRGWSDARFVTKTDGQGRGVTQDSRVLLGQLHQAGMPGLPDDPQDVCPIWLFAWAQEGNCPAPGYTPGKHGAMSHLLNKYFSGPALEAAVPGIRKLAEELLDEFMPPGGGIFDAATYTRLLAIRATALLAGFPCDPGVEAELTRIFDDFTLHDTVAKMLTANPAEDAFFRQLLDSGARGLIEDVRAGDFTPAEQIAMVRGPWYAGTDTTSGTLATMLGRLASPGNREFAEQARKLTGPARDDFLLRSTLETARLDPTFPEMPLQTYEGVILPSGVPIPAGAQILIVVTAVNRAAEVAREAPDEWRPDLHRSRGMGFGDGLHACVGKALALKVIAAGAAAVLDRTSDMQVARWRSRSGLVTYIGAADLDCKAA